jgi:hypothetical protein
VLVCGTNREQRDDARKQYAAIISAAQSPALAHFGPRRTT